ncbi:probable enoyl-CoA hydratase [Musca vetustissima]|uniref:probable enoyl-CoA hydratase n=1 Tax=Musca vetustissima TaxID=27455 RepID=UPI002AB74B6E|nr:probable enoyl-CoA hydratase [Musca vetustissima]
MMLRQLTRQICRSGGNLKKTLGQRTISTTQCLHDGSEEGQAEEKTVLVDKEKNITMIGINRPQQRNAINAATAAKLCEAFSAFEADETSPIAVLYGVGGSFCSGFDILEMAANDEGKVSMEMLMMPEGSVGPTRRHLHKPVVCGINGYCVANGLELALMCDLRVMEESAVLGFFNRRFGVPVIDGGTARLPAMIGFARALDLILTGRQVNAEEAHAIGLVNRIVPTGNALIKALELAHTLAKFPQSALNHDRNSLYSSVFEAANFHQAIQNEIMYTSKDMIDQMKEGITWFTQTFKDDNRDSWLKRDKSMADWDDQQVAEAAAQKEAEKQAQERARIEEEKRLKEEKEKKKAEKKKKSDEPEPTPKE